MQHSNHRHRRPESRIECHTPAVSTCGFHLPEKETPAGRHYHPSQRMTRMQNPNRWQQHPRRCVGKLCGSCWENQASGPPRSGVLWASDGPKRWRGHAGHRIATDSNLSPLTKNCHPDRSRTSRKADRFAQWRDLLLDGWGTNVRNQPAPSRFTSVREKSCPLNKSGSPLDSANA